MIKKRIVKMYQYVLSRLNDKTYSIFRSIEKGNGWPDFKAPKTFNEKIQWLKLNDRDPVLHTLVDKYLVREYVRDRLGERYLNELYGTYASSEEIDFEQLPKKFVIKVNRGCGWNILCTDKSALDQEAVRKQLDTWLASDYYKASREWVYKDIKPCIIIEKFLEDPAGNIPKDYKIFCFNGEPRMIQVDFARFIEHRQNFYDENWDRLPIKKFIVENSESDEPRPENLEEMLSIARSLSKNFCFARIDVYLLGKKIVFGEITMYPMSGFTRFHPSEWNSILGSWLDITQQQ